MIKYLGSYDFNFVDFDLQNTGVLTPWVQFTPVDLFTNFELNGAWRRLGDILHFRSWGTFTGTPTGGSHVRHDVFTNQTMNVRTNPFKIDSVLSQEIKIATCVFFDNSTGRYYMGHSTLAVSSSADNGVDYSLHWAQLSVNDSSGIFQGTPTNPISLAVNDMMCMESFIPILEWSNQRGLV